MLHIITSNIIPVKNIKDYNDNFILVHLFQKEVPGPYSIPRMKFDFHIFHQDEMELEQDEYLNTSDMEFHFNPEGDITQSLDQIVQTLDTWNEKYNGNDDTDQSNPEEFQIVVACDKSWNKQVVKYLKQKFHDTGLDMEPLDLFKFFGIVEYDKLKEMLKSNLGTEFIYPEEPISFSYALFKTFDNSNGF